MRSAIGRAAIFTALVLGGLLAQTNRASCAAPPAKSTCSRAADSRTERLDAILAELKRLDHRLEEVERKLAKTQRASLLASCEIGKVAFAFLNAVGIPLNLSSSDPNQRIKELLSTSEDLRQIEAEWERIWFSDQPSHLARSDRNPKPPAPGVPCQVVTTWQKQVVCPADPRRNGVQAHGLTGRLYLFGQPFDYPMTGDGSLVVEMYDASGEKPVMVEHWEIAPPALRRLLREDLIGWGYTLFLPSDRWTPEMTKIVMKSCYRPARGAPLFTETEFTLDSPNGE